MFSVVSPQLQKGKGKLRAVVLEGRLLNKVLCSDSVGPPFVLCPSCVTATKIHSRDDRKKSWLEKRNVAGAPFCSLAAKISPKWRMNEWMDLGERRADLLCGSVTGKDSWENQRDKWCIWKHVHSAQCKWITERVLMLPSTTIGTSWVPQHFQSKCLFVSQTRMFPVNIYLWSVLLPLLS